YGELVRFTIFGQPVFLVTKPDYVRDILVTSNKDFHKSSLLRVARFILGDGLLTSEDDFHKRQRRMMQPAFHSQRINGYAETRIDYAGKHADAWINLDGQPVDLWDEMMRLTLAIVSKTLFNADVEGEEHELSE